MNSFNIIVYYLVFANYSQKTLPMMRKKRKSLFPTALPIMDQCLLILRLISGWTSGPVDQWTSGPVTLTSVQRRPVLTQHRPPVVFRPQRRADM